MRLFEPGGVWLLLILTLAVSGQTLSVPNVTLACVNQGDHRSLANAPVTQLTISVDANACVIEVFNVIVLGNLVLASNSHVNVSVTLTNFTVDGLLIATQFLKGAVNATLEWSNVSFTNASGQTSSDFSSSFILAQSTNAVVLFSDLTLAIANAFYALLVLSSNASVVARRIVGPSFTSQYGCLQHVCDSCTNSSVHFDNIAFTPSAFTVGSAAGYSAAWSNITLSNILMAPTPVNDLGGVAGNSTACRIKLENVTAFGSFPSNRLLINVLAYESIDARIELINIRGSCLLNAICNLATGCRTVMTGGYELQQSLSNFGSLSTGSELTATTLRSGNLSFVMACSQSVNCRVRFFDVVDMFGSSFSIAGFASQNASVEVTGVRNVTNCFTQPLSFSGNGHMTIRDVANMTDSLVSHARDLDDVVDFIPSCVYAPSAAMAAFCKILSDFAPRLPSVNSTIILRDVVGITHTAAFTAPSDSSVPFLSIAAALVLDNVTHIVGSFAPFLAAAQTTNCSDLIPYLELFSTELMFSRPYGNTANPCDAYPAASTLTVVGGDASTAAALKGVARGGVNVTLTAYPTASMCILEGLLPATGTTAAPSPSRCDVAVVVGEPCDRGLLTVSTESACAVSVDAEGASSVQRLNVRGASSVTVSTSIASTLQTLSITNSTWSGTLVAGATSMTALTTLDVSRNRIRDVDALVRLVTQCPRATTVTAEGNGMGGAVALASFNGPVARRVVLADGAVEPGTSNTNVSLSYTCGEAATATATVWRGSSIVNLGGWSGWSETYAGATVGPCACRVGRVWNLTAAGTWPCLSPTVSLHTAQPPIGRHSVSPTASVSVLRTDTHERASVTFEVPPPLCGVTRFALTPPTTTLQSLMAGTSTLALSIIPGSSDPTQWRDNSSPLTWVGARWLDDQSGISVARAAISAGVLNVTLHTDRRFDGTIPYALFSIEITSALAFTCAGLPNVTFTVNATFVYVPPPPPPGPSAPLGGGERVVTATSSAVGASVGSLGAAATVARLSAFAPLAQCSGNLGSPLDVVSSPTGLAVGDGATAYHAGAVVGNFAIIAAVVVIHGAAAVVISAYRGWPLAQGAAWAQFPSLSVFVVVLLLPVVLSSSIVCVVHGGNDVLASGIAAAGVAVTSMLSGHAAWMLLRRRSFAAVWRPASVPRSGRALGHRHWIQCATNWLSATVGEWEDLERAPSAKTLHANRCDPYSSVPSFVRRYELLFGDYRYDFRWFLLADVGVSSVIAIVAALSDAAGSCGPGAWAVLVLQCAYVVVLVVIKPQRERSEWLFAVFVNCVQVGAVAVVLRRGQVDDGTDEAAQLDAAGMWLGIALVVVTVLWSVTAVVLSVARLATRRAKALLSTLHSQSLPAFDRWIVAHWMVPEAATVAEDPLLQVVHLVESSVSPKVATECVGERIAPSIEASRMQTYRDWRRHVVQLSKVPQRKAALPSSTAVVSL